MMNINEVSEKMNKAMSDCENFEMDERTFKDFIIYIKKSLKSWDKDLVAQENEIINAPTKARCIFALNKYKDMMKTYYTTMALVEKLEDIAND